MGSDWDKIKWRPIPGPNGVREDDKPLPAMPASVRPVRREVLAGEAAELEILRMRDAEHVAELTTLRQRTEAAERRVRELEGAVRPLVDACVECIKHSEGYDDDEWAIEPPITYGMIRKAKAAIDAAGGKG